MARWYILRDRTTHGPYSEDQVRGWVRAGQIQPTDKLARGGAATWLPPHDVLEFAADFSALSARPATPTLVARPFPPPPTPEGAAVTPPPAPRPEPPDAVYRRDPKKWSNWAIAGLVCGILGLVPCAGVGGILGIVFSLLAINEGDKFHGKLALYTSITTTGLWALYFIVVMVMMGASMSSLNH